MGWRRPVVCLRQICDPFKIRSDPKTFLFYPPNSCTDIPRLHASRLHDSQSLTTTHLRQEHSTSHSPGVSRMSPVRIGYLRYPLVPFIVYRRRCCFWRICLEGSLILQVSTRSWIPSNLLHFRVPTVRNTTNHAVQHVSRSPITTPWTIRVHVTGDKDRRRGHIGLLLACNTS